MDNTIGERSNGHLTVEPTGKLIRDFFDEAKHVASEGSRLLRAELESAKLEIRRETKKVGPTAAMMGGGGVLAHVALLMFAVSLAALLSLAMPVWLAFAITGLVLGATSALLLTRGRNKLRTIALKPAETIQNIEEDQRWAKGLTQNARSNLRHDT